jgi:hypothetical protein
LTAKHYVVQVLVIAWCIGPWAKEVSNANNYGNNTYPTQIVQHFFHDSENMPLLQKNTAPLHIAKRGGMHIQIFSK